MIPWKNILLPVVVLMMAACHYDKPLGPVAGTDSAENLVGRWKMAASEADSRDEDQYLVVHRTADKKLVVDYQVSATEHWYFTGYPCLSGHPEVLELQFLGDSTGKPNTEHRFMMVKAKVDGDSLQWAAMDPDKLKSSEDVEAFRKAVLKAVEGNTDIFAKTQKGAREKTGK